MSLFDKLKPTEREHAMLLRISELEGMIALRDAEAFRRAVPVFGHLGDALTGLTMRARSGDLKAKATLAQFFQLLDQARDASSAITVVRNQ